MPEYRLVMVGNWNNSEYGLNLKETYKDFANITILDPIYDQQRLDLIRSNAVLYIHGHSAGGTNPSLVEAMYLGLPIITYGVSYNKVTTENKALYFTSEDDLKQIIQSLKLADIQKLGVVMGEIAKRRYTWKLIADKYEGLVQEALQSSKKPSIASTTEEVPYETLLELGLSHIKFNDGFYSQR